MIKIGLMIVENCSDSPDALLSLIEDIKLDYKPPDKVVKRGRQLTFSELSFLLLAVVAVVTKTYSDSELHRLLTKDEALRIALGFARVPHRTQILRRLKTLVPVAEDQISRCGKVILSETREAENESVISAIDGRMYRASGPRWHKKDRQTGEIPAGLRNVDKQSSWSKSGYRGWVQGYRLVMQTLVFPAPVPVFAGWRQNSLNEAKIASQELDKGRLQVTDVLLGDTTFGKEDFCPDYKKAGGWSLSPQVLPAVNWTWKHDLYAYRKQTIELLFQRVMQAFELKECPVKGEGKNGALVLASVWCYQICWLGNYRKKRIRPRSSSRLKMHVGELNHELCTPFI